ncbi:MAG: DHH family phosphoesterase [Thermicanus sp.]|nr:DHH family phosphoesterase [Thermicanus sp.]
MSREIPTEKLRVYHLLLPGWVVILHILFFLISWKVAMIMAAVTLLLFYLYIRGEKKFRLGLKEYQEHLALRVNEVGDKGLNGLPVAILLHDPKGKIEWHNDTLLHFIGRKEAVIGERVEEILPFLSEKNLADSSSFRLPYKGKVFQVKKQKEGVIYLLDVTEVEESKKKLAAKEVVLAMIQLDNVEEATQGMDDQQRTLALSRVASILNDWATHYKIFLRRTASDKFLALLNHEILLTLENNRFDVLDKVRAEMGTGKMPFTLSIGVVQGGDSFLQLGRMAQDALELALGRGGDQAVVREGERLSFYGGKSSAVEKRTRVRARVISHALRDLMNDSDQVLIMGHKMGDYDSIGAALGVARIAKMNQKQGFILFEGRNQSIGRLLDLLDQQEEVQRSLISPAEALARCTPRTLLVVVDTHIRSLLVEPSLLKKTNRVVVIDHHRRSEESIEDPILFYLEPYASSTSELVTELIQYQKDPLSLEYYEATALLAGIIVDTRHFSYRTGVRTFEAASFLRKAGADTSGVQALLKEELSQFVRRSRLISGAEIFYERIAIAVGSEGEEFPPVLIAQAADTLLDMQGVAASFVIARRSDGLIGISARSLGEMNVQVIMEEMGGGGHFNNAATQLKEGTVQEIKGKLLSIIEKHFQEGSVEE